MRLLPLLLVAPLAAGCRFWYKPVPVANAIGEERAVLAGDSMHVYRDSRFEVYGPNAESVYDGYEQLNRAYRGFDRYFGAPSRKLAFVLSRDSVRQLDSTTLRSFADRHFTVVQYVRPRGVRTRPRYGGIDYGGILWPIAPTAARRLLAEFARSRAGAAATGQTDETLLELFPVWYRAAVMRLAGDAASSMKDLERVRDKRASLIPLKDLLPMVRPPAGDSALDPSRNSDADEYTALLAAQSAMLARFLVEREGPAVVGRLGHGYATRRNVADLLAEFSSAPGTIPELERQWLIWIDTREN